MKKLFSIFCLLFGLVLLSSSNSYAQSNFKIGAGAAYGSQVEALGLQAGAVYKFAQNLRGAADLSFYFPDSQGSGDYTFWEFNLNGHLLLLDQPKGSVYALAGLNYATQKISGGGLSVSNSETGLNLGGGAELGVGFGSIYAEAKYAVSNYDQFAITGGLRFDL